MNHEIENQMYSKKRSESVVDRRSPADAEKLAIRLQARHIRARLSAHNSGERFQEILASLSDEELVAKDAEHHARAVAHRAQSARKPEREN